MTMTSKKTDNAASRSQQRMVRAMRLAQKKMDSYWKKSLAAEEAARSSDARWNEKCADYWKGRRDGLRTALEILGPNDELCDREPEASK